MDQRLHQARTPITKLAQSGYGPVIYSEWIAPYLSSWFSNSGKPGDQSTGETKTESVKKRIGSYPLSEAEEV